jgi:hypothetical protein
MATGIVSIAARDWSLAFLLKMYSAATDAMAVEVCIRSMQTISLVFFWDAVAVWLIVGVAELLRLRRLGGQRR